MIWFNLLGLEKTEQEEANIGRVNEANGHTREAIFIKQVPAS